MAQMSATDKIDVSIEHKQANLDDAATRSIRTRVPAVGRTIATTSSTPHLRVCPQCGHHFPVRGHERIEQLADPGTFVEDETALRSGDPLEFFDLKPDTERLAEAELSTGLGDAMITGTARSRACRADSR